MDYDTIASDFLDPPAAHHAGPEVPTTPARRLRDALEPLATHGIWCRATNERYEALGLNFMTGYVWGRAAALGEPSPGVVVSSFGVFEPAFLTATYQEGRAAASRADVLTARADGAVQSLTALLAGEDHAVLGEIATALDRAIRAQDGAARPLFSGLRDLPTPDGAVARLWRAAELVREHRGDGHLAACISAGLDAPSMTVLTEAWLGMPPGSYLATRGYGPEALSHAEVKLQEHGWLDEEGLITLRGFDARNHIEATTDASEAGLVSALGVWLDDIVHAASAWSTLIVEAHAFPADPFKRAAG